MEAIKSDCNALPARSTPRFLRIEGVADKAIIRGTRSLMKLVAAVTYAPAQKPFQWRPRFSRVVYLGNVGLWEEFRILSSVLGCAAIPAGVDRVLDVFTAFRTPPHRVSPTLVST